MEKTNYALISALYANKSRGLYSDIYFPIIKYAVVKLYTRASDDSMHYSSAEAVQSIIIELFGIKIPHVVIVMTLKKIASINNNSIELKVFDDGSYQVLNELYDEDENTFQEVESSFKVRILEIEAEFKNFVKLENIAEDGITFIGFISQNTDAVLSHLDNDVEPAEQDKYASLIFFLERLKRDNEELFKVANQLFWSSIIVAFLESDRPMVNNSEEGVDAEYYLDTSIVMGLLELSTPEMEQCAKEVCDIIKASGAVLKINPLTIEEIRTILQSVEANGAYEGSHIASAYQRRKLTAIKVASIRVDLAKLIAEKGVMVFPNQSRGQKRQVIYDYKGKPEVKRLASIRSRADVAYSDDNFREIHDLFMDDWIKSQRKIRKHREDIYFLTTNKDLLEYCRTERHAGHDYMISTSKVILNLWMHNTKPSDISSCVLTETMAQCLNSHRAKVRKKIHEVAKFFKDNGEEFSPELYRDILKNLYRRAKGVIAAVEANPEDPKQYIQAVLEGNQNDNTHFESVNSEMKSQNERLEKEIVVKKEAVENLEKESEQKSQQIGSLRDKNENLNAEKSALETNLKIAETALNAAKQEAAKELQDKNAAQKLNQLYAHRDELDEKLVGLKATLEPLEANRNNAFSYSLPKWLLGCGIAIIVATVVLLVLDKAGILSFMSWEASAVIVAIGGILIGAALTLGAEDRVKKFREKAYKQWDEEHPSYPKLIAQIAETEEELRFTKREIKNSTSQK